MTELLHRRQRRLHLGKGTVYFDHCEIKTVGRAGYNVQARNPADKYGYVFVDSKLTAIPALTGHILARIDVTPATGYPASHVAYVNCQMDKHISPKGWLITPAGTADTASVRFWEYQSTDLAGAPIDVSMRDPASKQLTVAEAMTMRDKSVVLGGWNPAPWQLRCESAQLQASRKASRFRFLTMVEKPCGILVADPGGALRIFAVKHRFARGDERRQLIALVILQALFVEGPVERRNQAGDQAEAVLESHRKLARVPFGGEEFVVGDLVASG